ncbi:hypothetical protein BDB00DRAFT_595624 [Zychaea mexicana]|uniref:uncharacterized protein n=1 Tax=Zychaea mexicana TaxID=64656 RepID=UPI0022FE4ACF|nr:uncharacterized protein BDB00DRAFT_595624 [Zychaea mexicana]KAI9489853.1 hypothetical protein BDB00DRAFT_595624 [Zychaea mexicana]
MSISPDPTPLSLFGQPPTTNQSFQEYKLLRIIDLHEIHSVVHVTSRNKYKYMFAISTPKRMYYLQADNQHELDGWIAAIEHAKAELALYGADDDDASSVGRDQAFAKDVISSYKSQHSQQQQQQQQQKHQRRRSSGADSSSGMMRRRPSSTTTGGGPASLSSQLDQRPSGVGAGGGGNTTHMISHAHVPPVDIPKPSTHNNNNNNNHLHHHQRPEPFHLNTSISAGGASSSLEQGLGSYSTGQTYPLSPVSDHQAQMHVADALASSEDDDEYSWTDDMANVQQEENRNRVLIDGYLLKLGRNKGWRKRWFVLRTDTLAYYEDDKEYAPHRIIPLTHIIDSLEIEPISKNKKYCFKIVIPKRSYVLCASSEMELESWLNALSVGVRRAKKNGNDHPAAGTSPSMVAPPSPLVASPTSPSCNYNNHLQRLATGSSFDSFENTSHISGVSGAGAIGGAGGALPGRAHHTHTHKLGRAK